MDIRSDFHIHTGLSLCANENVTAKQYIEYAKETGLKKLGFANHMWDESINPKPNRFYRAQTIPYNLEIKYELSECDCSGLEIFVGAEAEYHPTMGVALREENAEKFDFIIVPNSHTHMMMPSELYEPYEKHRDFMLKAYEQIIDSAVSKYVTAMAHPFDAVCCPYDRQVLYRLISDDSFKRIFSKTAEKGIAVEINTSAFPDITRENAEDFGAMRMFRIAKQQGCKFIFGSDAHSVKGQESFISRAELISDIIGLKTEDITDIALV